MPKYKLIKDLPCQKADDTEWEVSGYGHLEGFKKIFIFQSKEKTLEWDLSWGDPLTSGWFEEVKPKRWRASSQGNYFFVNTFGDVLIQIEQSSDADYERHKYGNYFRTEEQAKEAAKRIKKLLAEYQEEINKE